MARILSIDYGTKRTGLAVTDPLKMIANGLETVPTHTLFTFLENYLSQENVDTIVVGKPTQVNGKDSETMGHIRGLVKRLQAKYTNINIVYEDERFTSVLAHQAMRDGGLKKKARQNKALVDKISATIILQSYLDKKQDFNI